MKRSLPWVVVLMLISSLVVVPSLFSQIKQNPQTKLDEIQGTVQSIDKKAMTFVIRETGTGNLDYTISYTEKTTWTYRNGKGTIDELKDGVRVVAIGKAEGTNKLAAARVDIRAK